MSPPAISKNAYFGFAWDLTISTLPDANGNSEDITVSSSAWDPEALRIVFDVNIPGYKALWFAKISIYNMNAPTAQKLLSQGMNVTLKAGYQTKPYGVIFQGQIYQSFLELENVVDNKLTLMCYTGLKETLANFTNFSGSPNSTQSTLIQNMAAKAFHPITVGAISTEALSQTQYPRRRAFFGDPNEFFDEVASANSMVSFVGFNGLNVGSIQSASAGTIITYTPTTGILGTPQVTQDGVSLQVMMDARLQILVPAMQIKIDNAVLRQLPRYPGSYPTILDKDGTYFVMALNHQGDSRSTGGHWYTEIIGATSVLGKLALEANALDPGAPLDPRSPQ